MRLRAALPALALAACATGPRVGTRSVVRQPGAAESPDEAFGAQVEVTWRDGTRYFGEALGCDDGRVYLLVNSEAREPYAALRWPDVRGVRVRERGYGGAFAGWATLGTLSSLSHGAWLVLSMPTWLAVGIPSAVAAGDLSSEAGGCYALSPYARFPQGMPAPFRDRHFAGVAAPAAPPAGLTAPWDR